MIPPLKKILKSAYKKAPLPALFREAVKKLRYELVYRKREEETIVKTNRRFPKPKAYGSWGIISTPRTLFVAESLRRGLQRHGIKKIKIMTKPPLFFNLDYYVVVAPRMFSRFPPSRKLISYRAEQAASPRRFTPKDTQILKRSRIVLEYSLSGLDYLKNLGVSYPRVYHLPFGGNTNYAPEQAEEKFNYMLGRFLFSEGFVSDGHIDKLNLPLPPKADRIILSLPETIDRRKNFDAGFSTDYALFDGVRHRTAWIGCGLSFRSMARHALKNGIKRLEVSEDDALLPTDFPEKIKTVRDYLDSLGEDKWDVFSGLIADVSPETKILSVDTFGDMEFITIDKMVSTVFNIYSERALNLMANWDFKNADIHNTIDRFLEKNGLRVVTTTPFLIGHRDDMSSSLWNHEDKLAYTKMISKSEHILRQKKDSFLAKKRMEIANPSRITIN